MKRPVRIANCSGFFGDRLAAAQEMVEGGPIDVLTGDWLAELTMLLLARQKMKHGTGYARTFHQQMEQVLPTVLDKGIKVVSNAGGLDPVASAQAIREMAADKGLTVKVASVSGDDLLPRFAQVGGQWKNLDTGEPFTGHPLSANAYLGARGIVAALQAGADVVVTGRVTDAALAIGPAAWWHDWDLDSTQDLDALAGSLVAGHVIECGAQATGGNYAFFREVPGLEHVGFPIAEVEADGSTVITKHPGTGGVVNVGTVTAQLLYEIGAPEYPNPDVVARFDTIQLTQEGPDRVRISGIKGDPAPAKLKVCINLEGGWRNRMSFVLSGLRQREKAAWLEDALFRRLGGKQRFDEVDVRFVEAPSDAPTQEQASGRLHITVKSGDERVAGRAFSSAAIELALANYPGFFATGGPSEAQSYGVYWPALVDRADVTETVVHPTGSREVVAAPPRNLPVAPATSSVEIAAEPVGPAAGEPLGAHFAARSGDKGGNANVGIYARDDAGYAWLAANLTAERVQQLLAEARDLEVRRFELPNLRALNFVIVGILGEGVASSVAFDAQAKGLGEYLLSRVWPG